MAPFCSALARVRAGAVGVSLLVACLSRCAAVDGKKVAVKEVVFDSAVSDMQWLGEDHRTVLVQTLKGRLYRSTNGGEQWNDITDNLKAPSSSSSLGSGQGFVVRQLAKSPNDNDVILVQGQERRNYISVNRGETWRRVRQKAAIHTFLFHKTRPKWALMSTWTSTCQEGFKVKTDTRGRRSEYRSDSKGDKDKDKDDEEDDGGPCEHQLYLTKDLGRTFTLVTSYVVQFSWGDPSHDQQDRIYFTHFKNKKGDQPKLYSWTDNVDFSWTDDAGVRIHQALKHGNKFMISNSFIFVAKLKDKAAQTVALMASADGGETFRAAQLPENLDEKSYTVLDTSEGAVMLHVNHGGNVGNVYISEKTGTKFSLSLPNNVRTTGGDCEFDKVMSLEGIYLANQHTGAGGQQATNKNVEDEREADEIETEASGTAVDKRRSARLKGKDETVVRTVVSFDKGGLWSYLKAPKVDSLGKKIDCPPDKCWLHLHGISNFKNYAPFYSTENAVGIIMGTGCVGPYLRFEPDQTNTYLSRDGGLTWVEAHKGAFIYEFGDHGGLVVMADDIRRTKQVVFSWNEGQSWYDFELSDVALEVDNIVTEPNATSTKFMLYGTRGESGVLYHLDFEALGQPMCKGVWAADSVSSDYETWMPWDGRSVERCMLGRQVTYTRRKQTSECFNGEKFERPVMKKNCPCTEANYECEVGFRRQLDDTMCRFVNDGSVPTPQTCTSMDFFKIMAHRKVPGDTCEGGWTPDKVAVPCPAGAKLSKGQLSVLGSIGLLAGIMGAVTVLSRSEKFKAWFANYGFESFTSVKYSSIGAKAPETALDSVGNRFDADFMDNDDYDDGLMNYNKGGGGGRRGESELPRRSKGDRDRDRDYGSSSRDRGDSPRRGVETAAASVPKLAKPPGNSAGAAPTDEDIDLL